MAGKNMDLEVYYGTKPPWPNTALLFSDENALIIDTQFMKTDAKAVVARLKEVGKPLKAVLITHSHPDHVWGGVELKNAFPDCKFYARKQIKMEIELEFRARLLRWTGVFNAGPFVGEIPESLYPIEELEGDSFDFDGHTIELIDLKPAETMYATAFYIPESKTYVAGDQVYNRCHYFVGAGLNRPELWAESIQDILDNYEIDVLVPGHGEVGGVEIFHEAIEYLNFYHSVNQPLRPQIEIMHAVKDKYPDWKMEGVLYMTIGPAMTSADLIQETGGHISFGNEKVVDGYYKG